MARKQMWFTTDSRNQLERLDVCDYLEKHFNIKPKQFGSGKYSHCQTDFYCYSKTKINQIRTALLKQFPQTVLWTYTAEKPYK